MKKLLLLLALLGLPAGAAAQPVQVTPVEEGDSRLEFARPFADGLVKSDVAALTALLAKQAGGPPSEEVLAGLRGVVEQFGGGFEVQDFLNGLGNDVVVTFVNKADGTRAAVALVLDPQTGRLTGFAPVQLPRS